MRIRIIDLVVADLVDRSKFGEKKYGEPLTTNNGRKALQDAYEEALDLAMYLKQEIIERITNELCTDDGCREAVPGGDDASPDGEGAGGTEGTGGPLHECSCRSAASNDRGHAKERGAVQE